MTRFGLTRREVALVAGVLLLPIPLLAATGLNVPLPGLVERAVGSLLPGAVGADEPGASAVVPGSNAPARAATPAQSSVTSPRNREAASGAAGGLVRTKVGGPIGVDAPGTGNSPPDGGTPSGDDPAPGADPVPDRVPPPPASLPVPGTVPTVPGLVADEAVPDDIVPKDVVPDELPIDVSVGESGVTVHTEPGVSVDVSAENGPEVEVATPPLPPVLPVSPK